MFRRYGEAVTISGLVWLVCACRQRRHEIHRVDLARTSHSTRCNRDWTEPYHSANNQQPASYHTVRLFPYCRLILTVPVSVIVWKSFALCVDATILVSRLGRFILRIFSTACPGTSHRLLHKFIAARTRCSLFSRTVRSTISRSLLAFDVASMFVLS